MSYNMPPKSSKKQPYVLFCLEQRQVNPRLSGKSLPELVNICSEDWKHLEHEEKNRYVQMAKEINNNPHGFLPSRDGNVKGRFDCYGRSLLAVENRKKLQKYNSEIASKDIKLRTNFAHDEVLTNRFHILQINLWCDTDTDKEGNINERVPCEIGLVEFSIENGIQNVIDQKVDPGIPPRGFRGEWKIFSDKYHRIWLDNEDLCDNYRAIWDMICNTLKVKAGERPAGQGISSVQEGYESIRDLILEDRRKKQGKEDDFLPLFVMPKDLLNCQKAFNWLEREAGRPCDLQFYPLDELFFEMMCSKGETDWKFPSKHLSEAHLEKDVFLFTPGISCPYHERVECSVCAPAKACRQALVILDFCCQLYDIIPVEGCHTPWGVAAKDASFLDDSIISLNASFAAAPRKMPIEIWPSDGVPDSAKQLVFHTDANTHPYAKFVKSFEDFELLELDEILDDGECGTVTSSDRHQESFASLLSESDALSEGYEGDGDSSECYITPNDDTEYETGEE